MDEAFKNNNEEWNVFLFFETFFIFLDILFVLDYSIKRYTQLSPTSIHDKFCYECRVCKYYFLWCHDELTIAMKGNRKDSNVNVFFLNLSKVFSIKK